MKWSQYLFSGDEKFATTKVHSSIFFFFNGHVNRTSSVHSSQLLTHSAYLSKAHRNIHECSSIFYTFNNFLCFQIGCDINPAQGPGKRRNFPIHASMLLALRVSLIASKSNKASKLGRKLVKKWVSNPFPLRLSHSVSHMKRLWNGFMELTLLDGVQPTVCWLGMDWWLHMFA